MTKTTPTKAAQSPQEPQEDTPGTQDAPEHPQPATASGEGTEPEATPQRPEREAARYRRQLREAEAERDGLAAQLDQARTGLLHQHLAGHIEIERMAGPGQSQPHGPDGTPKPITESVRLHNPEDLFTVGGVDPATLWTDDGHLDQEKVHAALVALRQDRPELFHTAGQPVPSIGNEPERGTGHVGSFAAAFAPPQR